jgi:hypothetical protein
VRSLDLALLLALVACLGSVEVSWGGSVSSSAEESVRGSREGEGSRAPAPTATVPPGREASESEGSRPPTTTLEVPADWEVSESDPMSVSERSETRGEYLLTEGSLSREGKDTRSRLDWEGPALEDDGAESLSGDFRGGGWVRVFDGRGDLLGVEEDEGPF